ncbi:hypothetical protein B0H11DRAFT_1275912 [Mycena galericulata]|nr:hypothetical protein B0H11DRAFT_1275912 [Mycena galericulata]
MHQSLRIPEIVSMICDEVLHWQEKEFHYLGRDTSQTLAAMARTCKTFHDPSLDLLWSSQTSVRNVLSCMPGDIWQWPDDEELQEVRLTRPVLPGDWERPLVYSRRVKFLTFTSDPESPALYEILRMCLPAGLLFPNVQSVEWNSSHPTSFSHFRLFVGPRLTALSLGESQSIGHLSCLPVLAAECPLLRHLSITCSRNLSGRCQSVSFLVNALNHLRTLYVPCLDGAALKHLARLPHFNTLVLSDQSLLGPSLTVQAQSEQSSEALDDLDMTVTDLGAVSDVLVPLGHPTLSSLAIQFPINTLASVITGCYEVVAAGCDEGSLSSLFIRFERPSSDDTPDSSDIVLDPIPGRKLSPLFVFGGLTAVDLSGPGGFDLDDAGAANMARAWPRIESLTLRASPSMHVPSRVTLRALLSFAQFCPDLSSLQLQLDATVVPKWAAQKSEEKRPRQRSLAILKVMDSPVAFPFPVATFLSSLFPRLQCLITGYQGRQADYNPPPEPAHVVGWHQKWKTAEAALPALRVARTEERYWTKREHGED